MNLRLFFTDEKPFTVARLRIHTMMWCTRVSNNKAIVDYTSSALYIPVTPFPADPIFSERGSDGMIPCAA